MFKFRCAQQFQAEGPGELSVNAEDLVIAKTDQPSDGWIQVKSLRSGGEGFVPFAYLEFLSMQQAKPAAPPTYGGFQGSTMPEPASAQSPTYTMFAEPGIVPDSLQQPSVEMRSPSAASPAIGAIGGFNPFDMGGVSSSLPEDQAVTGSPSFDVPPPAMPLSQKDRVSRHSYAADPSSKDQYHVTNPSTFQATLELWRERERRFMKGEPERLPQPKNRVYFYWDRQGVRHGPLSEAEMRSRFETRQLTADTPISLQVDEESMDAAALQQYFPEMNSAFQKAPVATKANETMWVYRDDVGQVQGPFTGKQMRDWFQEGYFNAETLVRLATQGDDEFVQLGLLFPEGEGAFLSEGDQFGARQRQAEIDALSRPVATSIAFDGGSGFDQYGGANPYVQAGANPFQPAAFSAAAPPPAWGATQQDFPPPPAVSYDAVANLDPYSAGTGANSDGKALFMSALSGSMTPPGDYDGGIGAPPPAIGGFAGAPPPALQAQNSDEWGITWDDEPAFAPSEPPSAAGVASPPPPPEEQPIKTVAGHDDGEEEDDHHQVSSFADLERKYLSSVDALYTFLTRSLPPDLGTVQCKIKRSVVGLHVNYNLYELYLEREDGSLGPQIMIAQKHRKYGVDSYYNLAIGSVNKRETGKVITSLVFNTMGTHFLAHNDVSSHKGSPRDLACVVYQRNIGKGPRKFQVAIPALKEGSEIEQVQWPHAGSVKKSKMLQSLVSLEFDKLQPLVNKKPTWSKKHRAWTLNFRGRVTRSSVKNFQLVRANEDKRVVLQFGRIGTDTFTMDFSWPISPVAAFAICVSSLHSKLAVE